VKGQVFPTGSGKAELPPAAIRLTVNYGLPVLAFLERFSRPRVRWIAQQRRLLAILCLALGFVLALPIPFGNFVPALCLVLISLGVVQNDGILIAAALVFGAAVAVAIYFGVGPLMSLIGVD
jgi:hypothetical protein